MIMLHQDDYHVSLANFKGPLDLLLFLIRRAEVDITDIPIAEITDQYLVFLSQIEEVDIDLAGEFLVMAAALVEIKSRVLQKQRERKNGDADAEHDDIDFDDADPRFELVQHLLAYQRYRMAAEELDQRREAFANRFPARPAPGRNPPAPGSNPPAAGSHAAGFEVDDDFQLELDDAHIYDLFEAYERILESVDFSKLGEHEVEDDDTPIGLHQDDLVDRLSRAPARRITLQEAWLGRRKVDIIGLFLATLELVRQRRVVVVQDDIHGEIMLQLNDDPEVDVVEDIESDEHA